MIVQMFFIHLKYSEQIVLYNLAKIFQTIKSFCIYPLQVLFLSPMSYNNFLAREALYFHATDSAKQVLTHPDVYAPDHPYLEWMVAHYLDYAAMAIPDFSNGKLYTADDVTAEAVALALLLASDLRDRGERSLVVTTDSLNRDHGQGLEIDVRKQAQVAANCFWDDRLIVPLVFVSPRLINRCPIQTGITLAHELDHVYRFRNAKTLFWHGSETFTSHVIAEVAAYRLEEILYIANDPETYFRELEKLKKRTKAASFLVKRSFRDADPHVRNVRAAAYIALLLDHFDAGVGEKPGRKLIQAMRTQELVD